MSVVSTFKDLPGDEERLFEVVVDTDYKIVVSNCINLRSWELSIDQNALQQHTPIHFNHPTN